MSNLTLKTIRRWTSLPTIGFCLGLGLVFSTESALAQVGFNEVQNLPILYSPALPKSVSRSMPSGAKSLFWSKFTPIKGRPPLAVHVFALRVPRRKKASADATVRPKSSLIIDLFEPIKNRFRRINSVVFEKNSSEPGPGEEKLASRMHLVWLNQARRDAPILIFDRFNHNEYGESGDSYFLTFSSGWRKPVHSQIFTYFGTNNGSINYHLSRNEQGTLQVSTTYQEISGNTTQAFHWDASQFAFVGEESKFISNFAP